MSRVASDRLIQSAANAMNPKMYATICAGQIAVLYATTPLKLIGGERRGHASTALTGRLAENGNAGP